MYMLNITICCFKKKSEIKVWFLLNTYSFSTLKFNSLSDLIIAFFKLRIEAEIVEDWLFQSFISAEMFFFHVE